MNNDQQQIERNVWRARRAYAYWQSAEAMEVYDQVLAECKHWDTRDSGSQRYCIDCGRVIE